MLGVCYPPAEVPEPGTQDVDKELGITTVYFTVDEQVIISFVCNDPAGCYDPDGNYYAPAESFTVECVQTQGFHDTSGACFDRPCGGEPPCEVTGVAGATLDGPIVYEPPRDQRPTIAVTFCNAWGSGPDAIINPNTGLGVSTPGNPNAGSPCGGVTTTSDPPDLVDVETDDGDDTEDTPPQQQPPQQPGCPPNDYGCNTNPPQQTPLQLPVGRWLNTCPSPATGEHGHAYWEPTSLPWPSDASPYGAHGCADHTRPACSNTGPTDYLESDTSILSEYTWPTEEGPHPSEMLARLRADEIFFHAAATVPQCQAVNTCVSNPAHGHVPASLTDTSLAGHGCDPHPVPVCAEYGDPSPTYFVHDPAGSDTWPGHRLVTVDTHHNFRDTYCHTVPVCVPVSVVAVAAANTNPSYVESYDGPGGVPPYEYWHLNASFWAALDGAWLHDGDSTSTATATPIPECPPEPGPGSTTITVTAPDRLVHGGLLHPETFTAAVTGFNCTGFCGDIPSRPARIETVNFGMTLTATNGYLREPDQATAGTGEYAVIQCVPTPAHATLIAACAAAPSNDVTTTARTVAVVGLFYNATLEAATVADSQRVHPQIIGFTGTYRYWYMQGDVVATATAPLTVNVVSTAGADGQKVWSSLINPD